MALTGSTEGRVVVSRRLRGAVLVVVCAVVLAGCGNAHPGQAAQVGETSISDDTLQQNTHGFCDLIDAINAAQQGRGSPVPVRTAVLSAMNTLVMGVALDRLAARYGVAVSDAELRRWKEQLPLDFSLVPPSRTEDLQLTLDRVARNAVLVEKVGAQAYRQQNPGSPDAPPDQASALGERLASQYLRRVGAQTDPRYGQVVDVQRLPGTGSLSLPVSAEGVQSRTVPEPTDRLTQTQTCF